MNPSDLAEMLNQNQSYKPAPARAQHSPLPAHLELTHQSQVHRTELNRVTIQRDQYKRQLDTLQDEIRQEKLVIEQMASRFNKTLAHAQRLADALKRELALKYDHRQHDQGVNLASYRAWLNDTGRASDESREALAQWEGSK